MAVLIATLPVLAVLAGLAAVWPWLGDARSLADAARTGLLWILLAAVVGLASLAVLVWALVRLGLGLSTGHHPIHGRQAWRPGRSSVCWTTRTWLFPLYSNPHPRLAARPRRAHRGRGRGLNGAAHPAHDGE